MSIKAVTEAVFEHLNNASGLPPIAWPNVAFNPQGDSYLRVHILPAETVPVGIREIDRHSGIVQIDVSGKDNLGIIHLYETAEQIIAFFPRNFKLIQNGYRIEFTRTGWTAPAQQEPGWVFVPVSVPYLLMN